MCAHLNIFSHLLFYHRTSQLILYLIYLLFLRHVFYTIYPWFIFYVMYHRLFSHPFLNGYKFLFIYLYKMILRKIRVLLLQGITNDKFN